MKLNSLFVKIGVWLALNFFILLFAAGGIAAYILFGSSSGLLPQYWFSARSEDQMRLISMHLQYKDTAKWAEIIQSYNAKDITYHLVDLEDAYCYYSSSFMPHEVLKTASRIPKTNFTLCPDPEQVFELTSGSFAQKRINDMEAGIIPTPPTLFMRNAGSYWLGRALYIPDDEHRARYVLLAAQSPSFTGGGLFFDLQYVLYILLAGAVFSSLWWAPLIWHIVRPLQKMAHFAEDVSSLNYDPTLAECFACPVPSSRQDEIGRLCHSLTIMTEKLTRQMAGQRQFIRHIAHELNSPLWRCHLTLSVLEERLDGNLKKRAQTGMKELENLSHLTNDILTFLKAQSAQESTFCQPIQLVPLLKTMLEEDDTAPLPALDYDDEDVMVLGNAECIRRIVQNLMRNAANYAGTDSSIAIEVRSCHDQLVKLSVLDDGPGVKPEALGLLFEPFYRTPETQLSHPGGSGLGLAIVKNSAEQCGATAECFNRMPHGFGVTITFRMAVQGTEERKELAG